MDSSTIDKTIQSTASKALDSQTNGSGIGKLITGAIVAFVVMWLEWQVKQKTDELAKLKAEAANAKLDADQQAHAASQEVLDAKKKAALDAATAAQATASAQLAHVQQLEQDHERRIVDIESLKNWDELERLAGVPK